MEQQKSNFRAIREKFNAAWPKLLKDVSEDPVFGDMPEAVEWLDRIMKRNVPKGKQNRALAAIAFYNSIVKEPTPDNERLSYILGWIGEIGQAAALMADDIMDGSETRRGDICWYKEIGIGMSAINDSLMLENITYFILYKYFSDKDYFSDLLALGHDIVLKTIMGQSIDTRFALDFNFKECTIEKYQRIVKFKTSYYTFYQPYASALITAGIKDKKIFRQIEELSLEMGFLFQVQDDYLDCYGSPTITGKVGTDIIDQKCTWLLVKALEFASESQREKIEICYGSKMQDDEDVIKKIYKDLRIKDKFKEFERESYQRIGELIANLPTQIPQAPFITLLNALYKRNK